MKDIFTPGILQTIIICCTIIVIAAIAVSAYRINQKQERKWGSYIFISSVLLIISIAIFSVMFYGNRNVLDFISLASALISIILAVVTIIYSYFINSRSTGQIDKLNKAAEDVSKATRTYELSADSLQENIQKIISAVNRVEEKTTLILDRTSNKTTNNTDFANFDLKTYVTGFISTASPLGLMAAYACIKAKDANAEFTLSLFGFENQAYCAGFLIATSSTGLITTFIDFNNSKISVQAYNQTFKNGINDWITTLDNSSNIVTLKNSIDAYFESAANQKK